MEINSTNKEFNLYRDIQVRTGGEIYIGVVGPVRTGKSTFIKRFMDLMVLPNMEEGHAKLRAQDELPQSAGGKTITTTEPKFIPKEAAEIKINGNIGVKVRLIDCVGFMVEGASGHMEEDTERMVKTPWFDKEIPFTQAAEIGTQKVINDHSTIGIVITTDGSFREIPVENYAEAEERSLRELKALHKPFIVLLNSTKPYSEETRHRAQAMSEKYQATVLPVNCEQLRKEDINHMMEEILYEFPISLIEFYMPKWVEMLQDTHKMKADIIEKIRDIMGRMNQIKDIMNGGLELDSSYVKRCKVDAIHMDDGRVKVYLEVDDTYYYEMLSELMGEEIKGEYQLLYMIGQLSKMKKEYGKVMSALDAARIKGYGVVMPERQEITLEKPEVIKHGNKYGVKIKANSPSLHFIKANIETEIAPIVGTEEQAKDLIQYIDESKATEEGIWETNIFGKTVEQLVNDGINSKITAIGDDSQLKLQETMQKIVNESNGGMVCIII